MSTTIETQRVYVVSTSLTFAIPASYDPAWNELAVFAAKESETTGYPVPFTPSESGDTVVVHEALVAGDIVVVRCVVTNTKLFEKATRQALTSTQVNDLYTHCLGAASAANDKVLAEYGIVVTGNIAPEDIALQTDLLALELEVDLNTAEIGTDTTSGSILKRLLDLESGGTGYDGLVPATEGEAQVGTANDKLITPYSNRVSDEYFDVKGMYITVVNADETQTGDITGIINERIPKMLDGMYIKDLEVSTKVNGSVDSLDVTVKQDGAFIASATLGTGVTYVSAADAGLVTISPIQLNKGAVLSVDLANEDRTITGLTIVLTFGWTNTRYTP